MRYITFFAVLLFAGIAAEAQMKSVYTDLDDRKCKTLELLEDEGGSYKGECKGVGGYKLNVLEGDLRQSIEIVEPNKKVNQLKFWEHFGGFSAVGEKAEWRMKGKTPIALIVRLNVTEDPENFEKRTSYLIVAKITKSETCVTDIIKPSKTQNVEARKAADSSAAKPCKTLGE